MRSGKMPIWLYPSRPHCCWENLACRGSWGCHFSSLVSSLAIRGLWAPAGTLALWAPYTSLISPCRCLFLILDASPVPGLLNSCSSLAVCSNVQCSGQPALPPRLISLPDLGSESIILSFPNHRRELVVLTCSFLWLLLWPIPSSRKWAPRQHELYFFLSLLCPQGLVYFFEWVKEGKK